MDPPQCVQNAMMKQTKKPFTYTPGGIDLSEIKSPRMQRRIERNANYPGVDEIQQHPAHPPHPTGPLPPSALAAMQPQLQVQVLPSGIPPPPPGSKAGGVPPPPPPPSNIPPPPPLQPLPTQKVCVDNEVLERPDMTKIIPDNPMALLKKTGGPKQRNSFVEEMYNVKPQQYSSPAQEQYYQPAPQIQAQQQVPQPQPQWTPPQAQNQPQQRWVPPQVQKEQPQPQRWAPQAQNEPQVQTIQQPQSRWGTNGAVPAQNQQQTAWSPPVQRQRSPVPQSEPPQWSPPIIERKVDKPVKTSTAHLGSLYIPPVNQQQQQGTATPPSPPKRDTQSPNIQSPGTPTLKEAPKPWQKQTTTQELPPWAKRDPPETTTIEGSQDYAPEPQKHPNAVYITQPIVLQHPGPPPAQRYQPPKADAQGARVVPVKVENGQRPTQPTTPGGNERFSRQQSWGNTPTTPTQSNAFKLIQKITNTEGDNDEDDEPITEHAPKYPQHFQQGPPIEHLRKLKMTEGDRDLMNKFRQDPRYRGGHIPSRIFQVLDESGVDDENYLHNEVDPRYRGAAIPSKAFKLLQSMTDGPDSSTVPRGSPSKTPQVVRTIPIQIERDEPTKPYVHPSQQTVPEPKKYTGSSIPSRSFKILQAMTAPDSCANANEVNENYDPYQWGCYEPYPYFYPFPPYYYTDNAAEESTEAIKNESSYKTTAPRVPQNSNEDRRKTPVPWANCPPNFEKQNDENLRRTPLMWGYYPYPILPPMPPKSSNKDENLVDGGRMTPVPFVYYPCYYMPPQTQELENYYATYPPVWDPNWYYNQNEAYMHPESMQSAENKDFNEENGTINECSDRDDTPKKTFNTLQAIKSVKDIRVYDNSDDEDEDQTDEISEITEDDQNEDPISENTEDLDSMPHQLSIIFEESEKTDSKRPSSVLSDSTTVQDGGEEEEDDDDDEEESSITVSVKLNNGMSFNIEEENTEIYTSFTLKSPSTTPKKDRSMCRLEENEDIELENISVIKSDNNCQIKSEESQDDEHKETITDEDEDWWSILKKDDDDFICRKNMKVHIEDTDPSSTSAREFEGPNNENSDSEIGTESESSKKNCLLDNGPNAKDSDLLSDKELEKDNLSSDSETNPTVTEYDQSDTQNKTWLKYSTALKNESSFTEEGHELESDDKLDNRKSPEPFYEMQCSIATVDETGSIKKGNTNENYSRDTEENDQNYNEITLKNVSCKAFYPETSNCKNDTNIKTSWRRNSVKESVLVLEEIFQESREESTNGFQKNRRGSITTNTKSFQKTLGESIKAEILDDDDTSSASSSNSSSSESHVSKKEVASSYEDNDCNINNEKDEEKQPLTVKERIEALRANIQERQLRLLKQKEETNICVQNKITTYEKTSTKSSIRSFEEYSEEEGDSGVTSDMSRHISDEEFPELKKMNRYQRAATHSRLFKLLQEDCEEEKTDDEAQQMVSRRDQLTLPLNSDDSLSSSGLVSPVPSVNDKLVNELVQSMLKRKKGQIFQDLSLNKLEAAAKKVLVENIELDLTSEDSFLSPLGSTPAQTPQEFYHFSDYKPYYDSWNVKDNNDVLPSRAFRLIQEQGLHKTGAVKCPKINNKSHYILQSSKSPSPEKSINEVTSAS